MPSVKLWDEKGELIIVEARDAQGYLDSGFTDQPPVGWQDPVYAEPAAGRPEMPHVTLAHPNAPWEAEVLEEIWDIHTLANANIARVGRGQLIKACRLARCMESKGTTKAELLETLNERLASGAVPMLPDEGE